MDVTVLGSGAAYPRAGGACTGFLLHGTATVWLDAGNGTFSRLQQIIDHRDLDALVISHGHADHVADVLPLMYSLGFDPERAPVTLDVYAPGDVAETITWPLGGTSLEIFKQVFRFHRIEDAFTLGCMAFEPFRTKHPAETYGVRVTEAGRTLVYTSDTAFAPEIVDACRGADLLITEATYIDGVEAAPGVHMYAREAGALAAQAGAKRLLLTHIWPTFPVEVAVEQASQAFDGPVDAAAEGERYTV